MVSDPKALPASASAQTAAELLTRPEVRAVLVVDGEQLLGAVTCDALVEGVVAAGRDPRTTEVRDVAVPVPVTVPPEMQVDEAYRLMEDEDLERVPVTESGRLVGVLSRSALTRRLAEDEPPAADPELAGG